MDNRRDSGETKDAVRRYLVTKYPKRRLMYERQVFFRDGEEIREIQAERLNEADPETRFLRSTVWSYSEYPQIPIIVAVRRVPGGGWEGVADCPCWDWSSPPQTFLGLFRGHRTSSDNERRAVGADIAWIFATTVPEGLVKNASYRDGQYECDVRGTRKGREKTYFKLVVSFGKDGLITDVREIRPRFIEPRGTEKAMPPTATGP